MIVKISQDKEKAKTSIDVGSGGSISVPSELPISEINYSNNITPIDAFTVFPEACSTLVIENEEDRLKYHKNKEEHLLTKSKCWDYESEVRLLINSPSKYIFGESAIKPYKRVFYYDFTQVVGVIFGARISEDEKEALTHILTEKLKKESLNVGSQERKILFDFMFQQAELSPDSRKINIKNIGVARAGTLYTPSSKDFSRYFEDWKKGSALVFENGGCRQETFI